ncbi:hypothetical protein [Crossiella sp. NPDC003009]
MKRALAVLVVLTAAVLIFRGCDHHLQGLGATVHAYFRAVGSGDPAAACRVLTGAALAKLQDRLNVPGCEKAVARLTARLTEEQRAVLRARVEVLEYRSAIMPDFSSRIEVTMAGNPLGQELFVLGEVDGREQIVDWGWDVRRLS